MYIYEFVHICIYAKKKVHIYKYVYRVITGHRNWQTATAAWNLDVRLEKRKTVDRPRNICLETRWLGHFSGFYVPR